MNRLLSILTVFYGWLLSFYPREFRDEFGGDMLQDFEDALKAASQNGFYTLLVVLLRELLDLPLNLLHAHLDEKHMIGILRSQPVQTGFRGAIGFGLAFAGVSLVRVFLVYGLTSSIPWLSRLGMLLFDRFRGNNQPANFSIEFLIISILAAVIFGIVFSLLFSSRGRFSRFMLAGMLGWLAPNAIGSVFYNSISVDYYITPMQNFYLSISLQLLTGAFFGVILSVVESEKKTPLFLLAVITCLFPVITYFSIKVFYYFDVVTTPWFFAALMGMSLLYFTIVLAVALSAEKRMLWMVVVGALINPLADFLPYLILPQKIINPFYGLGDAFIVNNGMLLTSIMLKSTFQQALFGIQLGLMLGIVLGFLKKGISNRIET
ncbi:MAG: hypothetical protein HY863_04775 [Chloroflexi bacterium]|nr:hypothetical protein [Chloroflexota bacterium]